MNENEYNNLLNKMNYLNINDQAFQNNININNNNNNNKQLQLQSKSQPQQNMTYDSLNDMIMSDYCECETSMFNNGYFSSSIYH